MMMWDDKYNDDYSFLFFDELRKAIANGTISSDYPSVVVETAPDSSVIRLSQPTHRADADEDDHQNNDNGSVVSTMLRMIHLAVLLDITRYQLKPLKPLEFVFSHVKSVIMAQYHFNNRIESVVPNLKALLAECNVRMTLDFYDSQGSPAVGTMLMVDHIYERPFPYQVTAVQGAILSTVSIATAILNSVQRVPQISHASSDVRFDQDRDTYRLFGRTIPANMGIAAAAMDYFRSVLQVQHVGILYVPGTFTESFQAALVEWGTQHGMMTKTVAIQGNQQQPQQQQQQQQNVTKNANETSSSSNSSSSTNRSTNSSGDSNSDSSGDLQQSVRDAMDILKATGYRYFMAVIFTEHFEVLLTEATAAGIMGPEYFWMFPMSLSLELVTSLRFPANAPEAQSLQGMAIVSMGITNEYFTRFQDEYNRFEELPEFRPYFVSKQVSFFYPSVRKKKEGLAFYCFPTKSSNIVLMGCHI